MSALYQIFSPLTPKEALALEEQCNLALAAYRQDHADAEEASAVELASGRQVPDTTEVVKAYKRLRLALPKDVRERLGRCRSVVYLDRPDPRSPLHNTVFRYLLERTGEGLCLRNDYPLEPTEDVLQKLKRKKSVRGFGEAARPKKLPAGRRDAQPGEVRAVRILEVLKVASRDRDLAIDVRNAVNSAPKLSQRYLEFLLEEGALPDAAAQKALRCELTDLAAAADQLAQTLSRLTDPNAY